MEKLTHADLLDLTAYEKIRAGFRQKIIDLKKIRRVSVGDRISLVFENRETVLFQIQEMIRTERIVDEEKLQEELDTYNALLPDPGELSATLFIEIEDQSRIKEDMDRLQGIDQGKCLLLALGPRRTVPAIFEEGRSKEDKISAVHYVRFTLDSEAQLNLAREKDVRLIVNHSRYKAETRLGEETRLALLADLR